MFWLIYLFCIPTAVIAMVYEFDYEYINWDPEEHDEWESRETPRYQYMIWMSMAFIPIINIAMIAVVAFCIISRDEYVNQAGESISNWLTADVKLPKWLKEKL